MCLGGLQWHKKIRFHLRTENIFDTIWGKTHFSMINILTVCVLASCIDTKVIPLSFHCQHWYMKTLRLWASQILQHKLSVLKNFYAFVSVYEPHQDLQYRYHIVWFESISSVSFNFIVPWPCLGRLFGQRFNITIIANLRFTQFIMSFILGVLEMGLMQHNWIREKGIEFEIVWMEIWGPFWVGILAKVWKCFVQNVFV